MALLRFQVEDVNSLIRAAGQRKVDTLMAIKDFRGNIHKAHWENARLDLQVSAYVHVALMYSIVQAILTLQHWHRCLAA